MNDIAGFRSLAVDLHPTFNLICGANGIGKSSLLDVIAEVFTGPFQKVRRRAGTSAGDWRVLLSQGEREVEQVGKVTDFSPMEKHDKPWSGELDARKFIYIKATRDLPYQRLDAVRADRDYGSHESYRLAYTGLSNDDLKGWLAQRWLFSSAPGGLNPTQQSNLDLARKCFSALSTNVEFTRVEAGSLELFVSTPGGEIYFEYLSSGFKSALFILLGLIKEIEIRRLPESAEDFDGVVLIDELDLHLHPAWQQAVTPALKGIFPKAQFIVTTHSPHMIQVARVEEVIALVPDPAGFPLATRFHDLPYGFLGWNVEEILQDVMGLRDTMTLEYRAAVQRFDRAVDSDDQQEAESALRVLEGMLHPDSHLKTIFRLQAAAVVERGAFND